jgi:hypothetical protein
VNPRWKPVFYLALALAVVWGVAMAGFAIARNSRMTIEKLNAYVRQVDLAKLNAADRAKALKLLANKLNSLSAEERRRARFERSAMGIFEAMTEQEKGDFIEATMPAGFKQMISSFEQLPDEKRRRVVDDALKRLREAQSQMGNGEATGGPPMGGNAGQGLSEELQTKVRTIGLKTFYSQSSAQTKAELAPLLEELQRAMESGRAFRR